MMMRNARLQALLLLLALISVPAKADFVIFSQPTAPYLASTLPISFGTLSDGALVTSITDNIQTVTFNETLTKGQVPAGGWTSWGSPPNTQNGAPPVLITSNLTTSLTLNLQNPSSVFGFELEPGAGSSNVITVDFKQGSTTVGSIPLAVDSNAGALLFAASTTTNLFTSIVINAPSAALGFAMAQFRYSTFVQPVPEPSTYALGSLSALTLAWINRRRKAAKVA
jgi:hypothetical protein